MASEDFFFYYTDPITCLKWLQHKCSCIMTFLVAIKTTLLELAETWLIFSLLSSSPVFYLYKWGFISLFIYLLLHGVHCPNLLLYCFKITRLRKLDRHILFIVLKSFNMAVQYFTLMYVGVFAFFWAPSLKTFQWFIVGTTSDFLGIWPF